MKAMTAGFCADCRLAGGACGIKRWPEAYTTTEFSGRGARWRAHGAVKTVLSLVYTWGERHGGVEDRVLVERCRWGEWAKCALGGCGGGVGVSRAKGNGTMFGVNPDEFCILSLEGSHFS